MTPGAWAAITAWGICGKFTEPAVIAPRMDAPATASWNKRGTYRNTAQTAPVNKHTQGTDKTGQGKDRQRLTWTRPGPAACKTSLNKFADTNQTPKKLGQYGKGGGLKSFEKFYSPSIILKTH